MPTYEQQTCVQQQQESAQNQDLPGVTYTQPYGNQSAQQALSSPGGLVSESRQDGRITLRLWDFAVNSTSLKANHRTALLEILEEGSQARALVCHSITGHASPEGEEGYNEQLSVLRALAVEDFLGVGGPMMACGEAQGQGAPESDYPYYRAVDVELELIWESDGRISELEAEIARLQEEISMLETQARDEREAGEGLVDDTCGKAVMIAEGDDFWTRFWKIAGNAAPSGGDAYGEDPCLAADMFNQDRRREAERLEEEAAALRARRDRLEERRLDGGTTLESTR